jgi:hypothetical protein
MARILANCRIILFLSYRQRFAIFDYIQSLFKHLRFTDSSVRQTQNDLVILFTPCLAISPKPGLFCTTVEQTRQIFECQYLTCYFVWSIDCQDNDRKIIFALQVFWIWNSIESKNSQFSWTSDNSMRHFLKSFWGFQIPFRWLLNKINLLSILNNSEDFPVRPEFSTFSRGLWELLILFECQL